MSAVVSSVKLHLNRRSATFLVPLYIAGTVAAVSVLISLVFWRAGSEPGSRGWIEGSQSNPGIAYGLAGFLVYLGVASVATTFPFALTLGATRGSFVAGTVLWDALTSAYIAVLLGALMLLERATGHWFTGFYIFDVYVLGAGDIGRLLGIVFLAVLGALSLGGLFGAGWMRFGARGPLGIAVLIVLVLAVALLVVIPDAAAIAAAFRLWWLAVAAGILIVLTSLGMWFLLRSAVVR